MARTVKSRPMAKWKPAPDKLVRAFEKAIRAIPEAKVRMTFGYPSATYNGNMFTGLHQESMILRLSPDDRAELARLGAKAFEPMPGRPMREYLVVPESVMKSDKKLNAWLVKSFAYCKSLPAKSDKARSKKTS